MTDQEHIDSKVREIVAVVRSLISVPLIIRNGNGVLLSGSAVMAVEKALTDALSEEFRKHGLPVNAISGADIDYLENPWS